MKRTGGKRKLRGGRREGEGKDHRNKAGSGEKDKKTNFTKYFYVISILVMFREALFYKNTRTVP